MIEILVDSGVGIKLGFKSHHGVSFITRGKKNRVDMRLGQSMISPMYESRGSILLIHDVQSFASGFTKREFVINTGEKYPQQLKFELVKDRCAMLDGFSVGDDVLVQFDIRGNEYNGKHYVSLSCWKLQMAGAEADSTESSARPRPGTGNASYSGQRQPPRIAQSEPTAADLRKEDDFDDADEIPF
jgi:hypothetical protein